MHDVSDCVFCEIVAHRAEATLVRQDDLVTAFMDTQPVNAGHVLVVPNEHATFLADLPEETGTHMFRVAQRVARALRDSGLPCEGVNLFLADGEAAGQEVFHVHLHVFPRVSDDGFGFRFGESYFSKPTREELDERGRSIEAALQSSIGNA